MEIENNLVPTSTIPLPPLAMSNCSSQFNSPINTNRTISPNYPSAVHYIRSLDGDTCFRCNEKGHWAINCPIKTPNKPKISSSEPPFILGPADGLRYSPPSLFCRCGTRCKAHTSNTSKNPNRKFYSCPLMNNGCDFFAWEDSVKAEELVSAPECGCGAGFCRIYTETNGSKAVRKYFACPIKKGQGACSFFKLFNGRSLTSNNHEEERIGPPQSVLMNYNDPSLMNSFVDGISCHDGEEIGSYTLDNNQHPQNDRALPFQLGGHK